MANDNHLPLRSIYNEVMLNKDYYNDFFDFGQQKINFSFFELSLPDDDPVYTLKKVLEDLYFSGLPDTIDALYPKYNTFLSDNGHSPKYDLGDARMFVIEGIAKVRKVIEENRKRKLAKHKKIFNNTIIQLCKLRCNTPNCSLPAACFTAMIQPPDFSLFQLLITLFCL